MKRYAFALVSSAVLLLSLAVLLVCMAIHNSKYSAAQASADASRKKFLSKVIHFEFPDSIVDVPMSDVGTYSVTIDMPNMFESLFDGPTTKIYVDWNKDKLKECINSVHVAGVDAHLKYDEITGWKLVEDDYSRSFNAEELYNNLVLQHPETIEDVDMSAYMWEPVVKTEDMKSDYELRKKYNDFLISYTNGAMITRNDLFKDIVATPWDSESLDLSYVRDLLSSYDTSNKVADFTTTAGENIQVPYRTYGFSVAWEEEKKKLIDMISNGESCINREPVIVGYDNLEDTYIEIDIQSQHLWHYVGGELCCETDIVTGTKNRSDTPTGVYYISEKIPGKYLKGADYKTWVNQWMRLTNSGIGLHDAYWRHAFGKDIYLKDGSHGCINLPASYAKKLFAEVKRGYPVVIY